MDQLSAASSSVQEFSLAGKTVDAKVVDCYDGDTFQAVFELGGQLWKFNCRMTGYDTPEMAPPRNKPNREIEKAKALVARKALLTHLTNTVTEAMPATKQALDAAVKQNTKCIRLRCCEFDKYGRLLVEVPLDESSVNSWMIAQGHGYAYGGGTKDAQFGTR